MSEADVAIVETVLEVVSALVRQGRSNLVLLKVGGITPAQAELLSLASNETHIQLILYL